MLTSQLLVMSALALGATPRGVVYEFSASWCGPCQQMSPLVSRLERQGFPIQNVDVDKHRDFAAKYRISSIPAFVLVIDGKEAQRIVGATSESRLREMFAKIPKAAAPSKPEVQLASSRSQAATSGRGRVTPRPQKPRFHVPFLGEADDEPADMSEATVRANLDDEEVAPVAVTEVTPMDVSVRIRANVGSAINYGSGTIISSQDGRTIILTCGHICRGVTKKDTMEVDVFTGNRHRTHVAKIIAYNEKADVGLLEFPSEANYPSASVAGIDEGVKQGDTVVSVGCGGGDDPTQQQHRVTRVNPCLGPDSIECTGMPAQGRSGGGLFDAGGTVVGVCFASDPQNRCGLYAGLKPIQQLLDYCKLSHLYQQMHDAAPEGDVPVIVDNETLPAEEMPSDEVVLNAADEQERVYTAADLEGAVAASESAALKELTEGGADIDALQEALEKVGEAEVVCVVRPIKNPRAASRVVILNRASEKFVQYLTNELESDPLYNTTSFKKPAPATKPAPRRVARPRSQTVAKPAAEPTDGPQRYRRRPR